MPCRGTTYNQNTSPILCPTPSPYMSPHKLPISAYRYPVPLGDACIGTARLATSTGGWPVA